MKKSKKIILFGVALLFLGMLCVANTIRSMIQSFDDLAAQSGAATPQMLAEGIGRALISTYIAIPIGIFGLYFLIWGLIIYFAENKIKKQEGQGV